MTTRQSRRGKKREYQKNNMTSRETERTREIQNNYKTIMETERESHR